MTSSTTSFISEIIETLANHNISHEVICSMLILAITVVLILSLISYIGKEMDGNIDTVMERINNESIDNSISSEMNAAISSEKIEVTSIYYKTGFDIGSRRGEECGTLDGTDDGVSDAIVSKNNSDYTRNINARLHDNIHKNITINIPIIDNAHDSQEYINGFIDGFRTTYSNSYRNAYHFGYQEGDTPYD